jgi:hypothetical protein
MHSGSDSNCAADHVSHGCTGAPSFKGYCGILSQHIQDAVAVEIVDTGLEPKSHHETGTTQASWNANRKSVFIVASR